MMNKHRDENNKSTDDEKSWWENYGRRSSRAEQEDTHNKQAFNSRKSHVNTHNTLYQLWKSKAHQQGMTCLQQF